MRKTMTTLDHETLVYRYDLSLTVKERKVLVAILDSAYGSGYDFAFGDELESSGLSKHAIAGVVGSLAAKGHIESHEPYWVNDDRRDPSNFVWQISLSKTLYDLACAAEVVTATPKFHPMMLA